MEWQVNITVKIGKSVCVCIYVYVWVGREIKDNHHPSLLSQSGNDILNLIILNAHFPVPNSSFDFELSSLSLLG